MGDFLTKNKIYILVDFSLASKSTLPVFLVNKYFFSDLAGFEIHRMVAEEKVGEMVGGR